MIFDSMDVFMMFGIIIDEHILVLPQYEIYHDVLDETFIALSMTEVEYDVADMTYREAG